MTNEAVQDILNRFQTVSAALTNLYWNVDGAARACALRGETRLADQITYEIYNKLVGYERGLEELAATLIELVHENRIDR